MGKIHLLQIINKKILYLSISFIPFITGCGLFGPEYKKPGIDSPTAWNSHSRQTETTQTYMPDFAWWEQFNDPQLNKLITDALENNNNIQIAIGNILQAKASLRKVNYSWLPTANVNGLVSVGQVFGTNFTNKSGNPQLNSLGQNSSQGFYSYGGGFMPSYSVNIMKQLKSGDIAKLNVSLQEQAKNAVRLTIIGQVAGSYFELLGTQKQLKLQEQTIKDAETLKKYALVQYEAGKVSELNIIGLEQFIATLKEQIPNLKQNITQYQNTLRLLTNHNPGKIITHNHFDQIETDQIIPINLPSEILKARPDIAVSEHQLQISNTKIGLATSSYFPSISLTGLLGGASTQLTNLFSMGMGVWMAGLQAGMPVFDMTISAERDEAKAEYYSNYYRYIETVRNAFMETDNALSQNKNINMSYLQQKQALLKANQQLQLAEMQYQYGAISYNDALAFKLNADYMTVNLNKSKMNQMDSIVNLYLVFGGGYNINNSDIPKQFGDDHDI
jgi:NodT family efflux transporter outer membrane factor (OMF) lipoprotein